MERVDSQFGGTVGLGRSIALGNETDRLKQTSFNPLHFELGKQSGGAIESSGAISQSGARSKGGRSKGKDKKAPSASLSLLSPVIAGSNTYEFTVTYKDAKGIKVGSLGSGDILVTGINQLASLVSKSSSNKGKTCKAVYRVTAPGGTWDAADNQSYSIVLQNKQVSDSSRNFVRAGSLGTLLVAISTGGDIAPTANLESPGYFTNNFTTFDFFINYNDDKAIDVNSLGDGDILVTGPKGFSQLAKKISVGTPNSDASLKARYRFTAPGWAWAAADNGSYTISLQAGQVKDSGGNFAAAQNLGSLPLIIPSTLVSETIAPTASLKADKLTAGGSTYDFTVTYTDNVAIDGSTIDINDLTVVDSKGSSQTVEKVLISGSGNSYTATYQLKAPGGTWNRPDNGTYGVVVQPNQIKDINGNSVAASTVGNFLVDVPLRSSIATQSSNTNNYATDFTLNIDTSTHTIQELEFTYLTYHPSSKIGGEVAVTRAKFGLVDIMTAKSVQDLLSQPKIPSDATYGGYQFAIKVRSAFAPSDLIYFARLNDYYKFGLDGSSKLMTSNTLVFGVKTSNPDRSNPFALLDIALNGEDSNTTIDNVIYGNDDEMFNIGGLQ